MYLMVKLDYMLIRKVELLRGRLAVPLKRDRGQQAQVAKLEHLLYVSIASRQFVAEFFAVCVIKFDRDVKCWHVIIHDWQLLALGQVAILLLETELLHTEWTYACEAKLVEDLLTLGSRLCLWEVAIHNLIALLDIQTGKGKDDTTDKEKTYVIDAARVHQAHYREVAGVCYLGLLLLGYVLHVFLVSHVLDGVDYIVDVVADDLRGDLGSETVLVAHDSAFF